jgi:cytochrome c
MKYVIISSLLLFVACNQATEQDSTSEVNSNGLTPFQLEHGIGPITQEMNLSEIDLSMAERGKAHFDSKCMSCHKFGDRYVGPDLQNVTETRSPAYIMNMILNPAEMIQKHPEAKAKLAEYMTQMPYQNVTEQEAREILEYLRSQNKNQ